MVIYGLDRAHSARISSVAASGANMKNYVLRRIQIQASFAVRISRRSGIRTAKRDGTG